jgi:hypothetical protein
MTPQEMSAHNKAIVAQILALQEQEKELYKKVIPPVIEGEYVDYNHGKSTRAVIISVSPFLSSSSIMFQGLLAPVRKDGTIGFLVKYRASDYIQFVQDKFNK